MSAKQMIDTLEARQMMSATAPQVVGYLPDWRFDQMKGNAEMWESLTHVNYFSIVPMNDGSMPGIKINDTDASFPAVSQYSADLGNLDDAVELAHNNNLTISISLGGAGLDAAFPVIAADPTLRAEFVENIGKFIDAHDLDGVDLDWEPAHPTAQQVKDYSDLISDLAWHLPEEAIISAAVNPEKLGDGSYNAASRHYVLDESAVWDLDVIGLMSYDLDTQDHADLEETKAQVDDWIEYIENDNGVSRTKLQFGVPFYGRSGDNWNENSPTRSTIRGYNEIVAGYQAQNDDQLPAASADVLTLPLGGGTGTWAFNGVETIKAKTQFAIDRGIGGVMIWELGQDYFNADGSYNESVSLLPAIDQIVDAHNGTSSTGTITGQVFMDQDGDGLFNGSNYGRQGRLVFIDADNDGRLDDNEARTQTDVNGNYTFTGLTAGSYAVRATPGYRMAATTYSTQHVTVTAGQTTNVSFGERARPMGT